ncbi:glycoside hydrolase family 3 C-terminal domain-containing protein [Sphingomonas sp. M6A6_1c]
MIADLDLLLRGGATGLLMLAAVMSARAWFDDAFRPTPVDVNLAAALLCCTLYASLQAHGVGSAGRGAGRRGLSERDGLRDPRAIAVAWRNLSGDLAEARRRTRTIFIVSIGLIILWLLGSEIVGRATVEFALSRIASAAGLSMGSSTIAALQFGLRHPEVKAILAAWYPGQEGAQAIADVLTGKINPSGRLPITFPMGVEQLPRTTIPSFGTPENTPVTVAMNEGADVGYRWFARKGLTPMYAFGHGLTYTDFAYSGLRVQGGRTVTATVTVRNTGKLAGADVPQLYLRSIDGVAEPRLLAFGRVELAPGEQRTVTLVADPRLLARYDTAAGAWHIKRGRYALVVAKSASDPVLTGVVRLRARNLPR